MDCEAWEVETHNGSTGLIRHMAEPRFVCSFAQSADSAGEFYGLTVEMEGLFFHGFVWENGIPHERTLRFLCLEAGKMIDAVAKGIHVRGSS